MSRKQLLCAALLLGTLAGCSRDEPTPTSALVGDSWTLQSQLTVSTPKDGSAPTTSAYPITEQVTLTFQSDTRFRMEVRTRNNAGNQRFEGTYKYEGQALTFPAIPGWPTPFVVPRTFQVVELSSHRLVTERHWENIDIGDGYYIPTNYLTTDTYAR